MSMEIGEEYLISCSRLLVEKYKRMLLMKEDDDSSRDSNSSTEEKQKTMLLEEGDNSSRDSSSSGDSDSTDSSGSPPHKRPCRTIVFTPFDNEDLLKIEAEDILVEDYVDWFMSLRAGVNEDQILWPQYYCEWFSTLESEAKADAVLPYNYTQWYVTKFNKAPPMEYPSLADRIEGYGLVALDYFNEINQCDYEYVRDVALKLCGDTDSFHLNFYGRLKVSLSRPESEAPERLFFADVDFENTVFECCIVDSDKLGGATVLHPPDTYCTVCNGCSAPLEP